MLRLDGVHQVFHQGDVNEIHALRGVDLEVTRGQFVTVIGSNGAGKSTLFNVIAGLFPPTVGRIELHGADVTRQAEHIRARAIGRVFQNPLSGTAASMSIAQNLTLALLRGQSHRLAPGVTRARERLFRDWLALLGLGLEERLDAKVALLSGGQRQALTLLMATMTQPRLLLLDEHTAALDPGTAQKILELTRTLVAQQQLTTLMITHNMQQALAIGDRTLMMDAGRIVLDLSAEERKSMAVQDLVDKFAQVRQAELDDDELRLA